MLVLTWEHVIALVTAAGALSGIVVAVISVIANRNKTAAEARHEDAQADEAQASGAAQLLSASSEFVTRLVDRVGNLEKNTIAQAETIQMLLVSDKEKQAEIEKLKAEIAVLKARDVERLTMIDAQNTVIGNLRQRIDELNAYIMRLFDWIRERGLEPPTLEELV